MITTHRFYCNGFYCDKVLTLKRKRPGKFKKTCPKCKHQHEGVIRFHYWNEKVAE